MLRLVKACVCVSDVVLADGTRVSGGRMLPEGTELSAKTPQGMIDVLVAQGIAEHVKAEVKPVETVAPAPKKRGRPRKNADTNTFDINKV